MDRRLHVERVEILAVVRRESLGGCAQRLGEFWLDFDPRGFGQWKHLGGFVLAFRHRELPVKICKLSRSFRDCRSPKPGLFTCDAKRDVSTGRPGSDRT